MPDGTYCFVSTADPFGKLAETDDANNVAWLQIDLSTVDSTLQVSEGSAGCQEG